MRSVRLLHLRHIRRHPLRSAIAIVAVASGVALTVTTAVVQASTSRSFEEYARSFSGPAPLRVIGPVDRGGLREATVDKVAAMDGVAAAIPVIQAVALADGATETDIPIVALGYDCRIEKLVGTFGCVPSAVEEARTYRAPIMSRSLAQRLGPDGVLRTNDGPKPVRGATAVEELDEVNNGNVVALPIHVAQTLFTRSGAVDLIYVLPEKGVSIASLQSRIERAVGEQNLVLRRDQSAPSFQMFTQLYALLGLVGVGTFATGAVLAHNALALSLEDRRRDLAVAAAVGASPRAIFGGALAEGAVLGVVGGLAGACIGTALAYPVLGGFQFFAERFAGLRMTIELTPAPFVTGAVLGVLLGVISAYRPARRASRINVVAELQKRDPGAEVTSRVSIRRGALVVLLGCVATAITYAAARDGALQPWQPIVGQIAAFVGVFAFMTAVGQLSPIAFAFGSRFGRRHAPIRIAWANLVGEGWRSGSMVLAAAGAVIAGFMISNMGRTVLGAIADEVKRNNGGTIVVATTPRSNSFNLEAKPSPKVRAALEKVDGVGRVLRNVGFSVATDAGTVSLEALDEMPTYEVLRGRLDPEAFRRGEAIIGPGLARRDGIDAGDVVQMPGRDGNVGVRIQAVVSNGDTTGLEMTMPVDLAERIWGPQPAAAFTVRPAPGVDPVVLADRIEAANLDPHLSALAGEELLVEVRRENARFFAPFWALQRALIVIAFGAVLSNLLLVALKRQRELGLVSAVGMSPRGLAQMVVTEAMAIGVVAVVLGSLAAIAATESFRKVLFIMIPYPMPLRIDATAPFLYGGITLIALLAAALWPAWRTSRLNVVEALRAE